MKVFISLFYLIIFILYRNLNDGLEARGLEMTEQREAQMIQKNIPEYLYKIVSIEEWEESLLRKYVVLSSLDKDFIHLATEEQLEHVVQKFWKNKDYIILKLASKNLTGRLVYETNPGGTTLYYHLYQGIIPLDSVVEVSKVDAANQHK